MHNEVAQTKLISIKHYLNCANLQIDQTIGSRRNFHRWHTTCLLWKFIQAIKESLGGFSRRRCHLAVINGRRKHTSNSANAQFCLFSLFSLSKFREISFQERRLISARANKFKIVILRVKFMRLLLAIYHNLFMLIIMHL